MFTGLYGAGMLPPSCLSRQLAAMSMTVVWTIWLQTLYTAYLCHRGHTYCWVCRQLDSFECVTSVVAHPKGLACALQVVPHITDAIQDWIQRVAHVPVDGRPGVPDVCVIELGGTVGDIESMPFVEVSSL